MARLSRLLLVLILAAFIGVAPAASVAAATPAEATNDAVGYAGARGVTSFISVVDRSSGTVLAQTGNANSQVASESIMKLFLATYYLVIYGGYNSTPDSVKSRLSYMLRYSDDDTASSMFSANAIPTVAARYGLGSTINATDRPGHWGAARITAADMTTFLFRASQDQAVGPWLIPVMSQTERTGSGGDAGFSQYFGMNTLGGDHGSKQGWGCDSFWTSPQCAVHSVGYTDNKFVAVLQLSNGYPDPMRDTSTHSAQVIAASTIRPNPIGSLDSVTNSAPGVLTVSGWAADPAAPGQTEEVHVYVQAGGTTKGFSGIFTGGSRPDVAGVYPWAGGATGFGRAVETAGEGTNTACAYAINVNPPHTNPLIGCRSVYVQNAFGALDSVTPGVGTFALSGWALNPNDPPSSVEVHVYDFAPSGAHGYAGFLADTSRPDVARVFAGYSANHGYAMTVPSTELGTHSVCTFAINSKGGAFNPIIGCRDVVVANAFGAYDSLTVTASGLRLSGWALNPNNRAENVEIHVYDTGPNGTRGISGIRANQSRPDVAAAYPAYSANHGFVTTVGSPDPGSHTVCAFAITTGGGTGNTLLGCKTVSVP